MRYIIILFSILPFYLNDFYFHYTQTKYIQFIIGFYLTDLWAILMALLYFKYNIVDADKNNSKKNKSVFLKNNWNIFKYLKHIRHLMHRSSIASQIHLMKYSLILFVLGIWLDQKISNFLSEHFRWRYFHFPVYPIMD